MTSEVVLVRRLRMARGLTQREAATRSALSPADYGKMENGVLRPYPRQAARVADALGWDGYPPDLFSAVPEQEAEKIIAEVFGKPAPTEAGA